MEPRWEDIRGAIDIDKLERRVKTSSLGQAERQYMGFKEGYLGTRMWSSAASCEGNEASQKDTSCR